MTEPLSHLYRDPEGLYYFGTPDALIVLAPSAQALLDGIKDSLTHLDTIDPERQYIAAHLSFVNLVPLSACPEGTVDLCHPDPEEEA